ncbi:MAG: homoserine kinase [Elusimicrobiota bacterium]|nr:homoserine kinase [Elusimicrobiota bacterium]
MKTLARVTVSVPASTSNLGPGFDCLGLALDLRNELELSLVDEKGPATVEVTGEGAATLPRGEANLLVKAARRVMPARLPGRLVLRAVNRIPLARGLGSSAAAAVAGLWAGAHLFGLRRSEDELERLAVELEGHPDNVAPCVHGGFTSCVVEDGRPRVSALDLHPSLSTVVCVPAFELATKKARAVLPRTVSRADAVFNLSRALLLPRALAAGRFTHLPALMQDRLHQPYRAPLVPGLADAVAAATRAGAAGAALSGSGPTVFAFVQGGDGPKVGAAMKRAFAKRGVRSSWLALEVDHRGVRVS